MIDIYVDEAVQGPRATVVRAWAEVNGDTIEVSGEALRHPHDKNDPELAELLAYGRALDTLGRKLEKRANGLVRHNDHISALKQKQKRAKERRLHRKMTSINS